MVLVHLFYFTVCSTLPEGVNTKAINQTIQYVEGNTVTYECTAPYIPHGADNLVTTCEDTGLWSNPAPTCTGVY